MENNNYLEFIPVHAKNMNFVVNDENQVTIMRENKGVFYFLTQKLLKKPRTTQIHLDEMGSFIWPLIDGERNVFSIAEHVKEHFGENAEPLYNRLVTYMKNLENLGFIEMRKPDS